MTLGALCSAPALPRIQALETQEFLCFERYPVTLKISFIDYRDTSKSCLASHLSISNCETCVSDERLAAANFLFKKRG
jgi:hypothetical protein